MAKKRKSSREVFKVGSYGSTVRVLHRRSGRLVIEFRHNGKRKRRALGHRDLDAAKAVAQELSGRLSRSTTPELAPRPTVKRVLSEYREYLNNRPKQKSRSMEYNDARCIRLWTRVLGADKDLSELTLKEWQTFERQRTKGEIDAEGNKVPEKKRKQVRARTVGADLKWLRSVMEWATKWQVGAKTYLMKENPARGFPIPQHKNPRRPVADWQRYQTIRAKAEVVTMSIRQDGKQVKVRTHLPDLLDLAVTTGRRRSAICKLRYRDLRLDSPRPQGVPPEVPWFGEICWPSDADKVGQEWTTPINELARTAIDRILKERPPFNPDGPLFPSPQDPTKPIRGDLASKWLRQAEKLAGVEKQDGSLWHAYRRMWATQRKDLPVQDVAQAGGWKDLKTLQTVYQQADKATTYRVVTHSNQAQDQKVETR